MNHVPVGFGASSVYAYPLQAGADGYLLPRVDCLDTPIQEMRVERTFAERAKRKIYIGVIDEALGVGDHTYEATLHW